MGLLDIASANSFWRGYDYYKAGNVKECKQTDVFQYTGKVAGDSGNTYDVTIDIEHPKRSMCNCPHADGKRRICKHKVALYFSFFPEEAEKAVKEAEEWEAQEEARREEERRQIEKYVYSLSKQQLRDELLWRLIEENEHRRW